MRRLRWLVIGYFVIVLITGWPIASVAIATTIAEWNGCRLHEGFVNPCVVNGTDIGATLYQMAVMGWFMLATIPIGAIAFVGWTSGWIIWQIVKGRRQPSAPVPSGGTRVSGGP